MQKPRIAASGRQCARSGKILETSASRSSSRSANVDASHGMVLYLEEVTVSFDGFKALNGLTLYVDAGRAALHHRAERRRQDHHDGRHHRARRARRRQRLVRQIGEPAGACREPEIAQAGIGRKFQKPTVFEQLTVFENLELALARTGSVLATLCAGSNGDATRPHRATVSRYRPRRRGGPAGRAALPRAEAVAGDRHAARAGPAAAAARRAGGRHDRRGDRAHRGAASRRSPASTRWWWSSTTWTSSRSSAAT